MQKKLCNLIIIILALLIMMIVMFISLSNNTRNIIEVNSENIVKNDLHIFERTIFLNTNIIKNKMVKEYIENKPVEEIIIDVVEKVEIMEEEEVILYSEEDLDLLSRIINAEAGGESAECMLLVGNVVLNRVMHEEYPDTIKDVIYDRKYGVQYTPTINGHINKTPSDIAIECATRLLNGERFCPDNVIYQAEFIQGDGVYKKIGNTYFCY